jgi:iron complex outermembrane receptor protein
VQDAYTEKSDANDPNVSALMSWKNAAGNVGFSSPRLRQAQHPPRRRRSPRLFPGTGSGLLVPSLIGSALFQQERERKAFDGGIAVPAHQPARHQRQRLLVSASEPTTSTRTTLPGAQRPRRRRYVDQSDHRRRYGRRGVISSAANGTQGRGVVYDAIDRKAFAKTWYGDVDGTFTASDSWIVHFDVGHTKADGDTDSQPFVEFGAPASFSYDLRGKAPQVHFLNVDPKNPAQMEFDFASLHHITNDDSETYSYVDAEKSLNAGALKSLKFGLKYADHKRETDFQATTYGGFFLLPLLASGCGGACYRSQVRCPASPPAISSTASADRHAEQLLVGQPRTGRGHSVQQLQRHAHPEPAEVFSVQEKATAAFAMANVKWATGEGTSACGPCAPSRRPPATSSVARARSRTRSATSRTSRRTEATGTICRASNLAHDLGSKWCCALRRLARWPARTSPMSRRG